MSYVGLAGTGNLVVLPCPEGAASSQLLQMAAEWECGPLVAKSWDFSKEARNMAKDPYFY